MYTWEKMALAIIIAALITGSFFFLFGKKVFKKPRGILVGTPHPKPVLLSRNEIVAICKPFIDEHDDRKIKGSDKNFFEDEYLVLRLKGNEIKIARKYKNGEDSMTTYVIEILENRVRYKAWGSNDTWTRIHNRKTLSGEFESGLAQCLSLLKGNERMIWDISPETPGFGKV